MQVYLFNGLKPISPTNRNTNSYKRITLLQHTIYVASRSVKNFAVCISPLLFCLCITQIVLAYRSRSRHEAAPIKQSDFNYLAALQGPHFI
jgi:hypothetical protein